MHPFFNKIEILKGSKAVGMSIWIKTDDELNLNSIVIRRSKNKLSVVEKKSFTSIDEISKTISGNLPLYLSIDGKGVLHKIVEYQSDVSLIDYMLPGANSRDFVIQDITISEKSKLISVMRIDKLEEILIKINELGFDVLNISLGPFSVNNIAHLLEDNSTIHLPYYNLFYKSNTIEGFDKNLIESPDFSIDIESESLNSNYIDPLSNCIYHFNESTTLLIDYPGISSQNDNFKFKRLFRFSGWTILAILFINLLINFIAFDHYHQKNDLLVSQIGSNKEILNKIERLKHLIKTKEDFFGNNSYKDNPLFAYYCDRLAKEVPEGITLARLCLFPLQKQIPGDKTFHFLSSKIVILGYSHNSNYLDAWIKSLKNLDWINEIIIKNYNDNSSEPAKFELEIGLNNLNK